MAGMNFNVLFNNLNIKNSKYSKLTFPNFKISDKQYTVTLASNHDEIDEALQLRFEIFNLELGEGLDSSYLTFRDEDPYDKYCHHLIVTENSTGKIIGTYRMQTKEMADEGIGFYSAGEFKLNPLSKRILNSSIEVGRACIEREHRKSRTLFLLWKGIAKYMILMKKNFLFGCCSLSTQDTSEGYALYKYLKKNKQVNNFFRIKPQPGCECFPIDNDQIYDPEFIMPPLMKMYLRYGAKVCGPPAVDKEFKTIDFFLLLNKRVLSKDFLKVLTN